MVGLKAAKKVVVMAALTVDSSVAMMVESKVAPKVAQTAVLRAAY